MTAVPKPLKFLRPHYEGLTELYEEWPAGTDKVEPLVHGNEGTQLTESRTRSPMCYQFSE